MPRRACDRCHSIRARRQFNDGKDDRERCLRLSHVCRTERSVLKAGTPRKNLSAKKVNLERVQQSARIDYESAPEPPAEIPENLQDLDPQEVQLAISFLQTQRFENSFVSESDLSSSMQSGPIRLFLSAPARVKDALLALAGVLFFKDGAANMSSDNAISNIDRCCKAMERLRQADTKSVEDAKATLFVATTLISFNDMTIGYGFLPIARAALLSVEPWYHELAQSSEFDPHLIPVMFAEASECIRCRQLPTLRYSNPSIQTIDPSYGVAQEVLPHIYDICVLSHGMYSGLLGIHEAMQRARKIYEEVELWSPQIQTTADLDRQRHLSETQKSKILKHGECYKLLAQLLLHKLQPRATESSLDSAEIAARLRQDITALSERSRPQVQYLLFPYFVACTELQDEPEQGQVLGHMKGLSGGIATQACNRMFEFLEQVWTIRNADPSVSWLELVDDGVQFSIGP